MADSNKKDYVSNLDIADVVKKHQVFDVFFRVAKLYPHLASALFEKYVDFIRNNNKNVQRAAEELKQSTAEYMAARNIGYFIGNCKDFNTRKFLFKVYPMAYHPILGRDF